MPQIHDPRKTQGASRFIAKRSRRRRKQASPHQPNKSDDENNHGSKNKNKKEQTTKLIGEELLEFRNDVQGKITPGEKKEKVSQPSIKKKAPEAEETGTTLATTREEVLVEVASKGSFSPVTENAFLPSHNKKIRFPNALAIDSRSLDTEEGKRECGAFLSEGLAFLQALTSRGLCPAALSWTELQQSASVKKTAKAKQPILRVRCDSAVTEKMTGSNFISPAPIISSLSTNKNTSDSAVQLPKGLLADASWKIFGDLVESILQQDSKRKHHHESPFDISVLTNDVSFLSDTREVSHKRALGIFWDRIKPQFLDSKLRTLHIIVACTDSVVVAEKEDPQKEKDNASPTQQKSEEEKPGDTKESLERKRAISIAECVNIIQQQIDVKGEEEFKTNRSFIQFGSSKHVPSISIHVYTIDNTSVGFQSVLRHWSRERLHGTRRLTFDLPETVAFSQCSVSLDAMYKMVPFRLDSSLAHGLTADLELLSQSNLEVVQLVPISSIDASLLYGVAIGVKAGLEHELDRHNETKLLVGSLFKQLTMKDCALLIRSKGPSISSATKGTFHSFDQSFLLMAEELPSSLKETTIPNSGVLYRLAGAEQAITEFDPPVGAGDGHDEENAFSEYLEASLDCLGCSPINPMFIAATVYAKPRRTMHVRMLPTPSNKSSAWADKTGVGSAKKPARPLLDDTSSSESDTPKRVSATSKKKMGLWNDNSGIGAQAPEATNNSGNDEEISDVEPEPNISRRKSSSCTSPANNSRKLLIDKARMVQTKTKKATAVSSKPNEKKEAELTDTSSAASYCSPESDSDDSDARQKWIGVFDYAQS